MHTSQRLHPIMFHIRQLIPVLIAATAYADELTLETKPFIIAHSISATALPAESAPIRLDAEAWPSFKIATIAEHGASVKKDQPLIVFETEDIDKKLTDTRQAIAKETLELANAELALATLEKTVPEQLARLKRAADEAAEKLAYFTATSRKISEESADFGLRQTEEMLASYEEELKQLLQMYEADDITEDTEEIILKKQKFSVERAKFALKREILDHKRTKQISIPRQAIELKEAGDDTTLAFETGSKNLPRSIELKKLEVANLKTSLTRNKESLADIESDRKLFEIKAPADGMFYYGSIEDGKWTTGDLIKSLSPRGTAPVGKTFATFIASPANLVVKAFLDQANAQALAVGAKGTATLSGRSDATVPVTLQSLSSAPDTGKTYPTVFTAEWPEGLNPVAGQSLQVNLASYSSEKAIVIPNKALSYGPKGWTAEVKLADGKTENRPVTRGKSSEKETEITAGLVAGQVIIVP